jgi:hypothetical protein
MNQIYSPFLLAVAAAAFLWLAPWNECSACRLKFWRQRLDYLGLVCKYHCVAFCFHSICYRNKMAEMNPEPIEVDIYGRHFFRVPLPGEEWKNPSDKTRIEMLDMAKDGKLFGRLTGYIIDLKNLREWPKTDGVLHVPAEVGCWLRAYFGEAVLVQSLIPHPPPHDLMCESSSEQTKNSPA